MPCEVKVTMKDSEKKLVNNFLIYESFIPNQDDPTIKKILEETRELFQGEPERVNVSIKLEIV